MASSSSSSPSIKGLSIPFRVKPAVLKMDTENAQMQIINRRIRQQNEWMRWREEEIRKKNFKCRVPHTGYRQYTLGKRPVGCTCPPPQPPQS